MVKVQEGLGVLMSGAFANNTGGNVRAVISKGDHLGNPAWIYRIILGIGKNCSLVTDGVVANEGLSPRGMQNKDYNTYNSYCMVLPRLKATIDRIGGGEAKEIKIADSKYDEDDEKAEQKVIDLSKKQELWEVDVCSPLGYKWPKDAVDKWNVVEITNNF